MRVFLCAFGDYSVAIPTDSISSLSLSSKDEIKYNVVSYENSDVYISLLLLFNLPAENVRHIITLKNEIYEKNIFLLSTQVECEFEITNEKMFSVPKTLRNTRFSVLFNGIQFDDNKEATPTLLLNTKQINNFLRGYHD